MQEPHHFDNGRYISSPFTSYSTALPDSKTSEVDELCNPEEVVNAQVS